MAIEGDIQTILAPLAAGGCHALVNNDSLIVKPYIIFQVISNPALNTLDGDCGISNRRVQVDVWTDSITSSYGAGKALAKSVTAAMTGAGHLKMNDNDLYEPDTKLFRVSMDFSVWGPS